MIPQERNAQHSLRPQRNQPQLSTGAYQAEVPDPPFEGVVDPRGAGAEETAGEVFPTEDHRKTRTHQEEYQEKHRPYPTPPINLLGYHLKYSRATERRRKTSSYSGARIAELTETTPRSPYHSLKQ